ncbi:eukaryotic integral membrane protein-domain-containing protein [Chytriomyces cf. hyalinus JEL632]|nr:eukaryotic integral membrane protein-domain-containing protein [Chytriomyces cf. hyalinus JEL632]
MAAFGSVLQSVGVGTRAMLLVSFGLSIITIATAGVRKNPDGWNRPFEAIVGFLISRAWTYLTAGFVEANAFLLPISLIGILFSGRYFEKIWGAREFIKFALIVNCLTVVLSVLTVLIQSMTRQQNEDLLYKTFIGGILGLLSGFLVAFKQAVPEHALSIMGGVVSVRVKHLPSLSILLFTVLMIAGICHVQTLMIIYGSLTAWVYLRFYKYHDGIQGDRSESFSFGSFFPASTHRVIIPLSNSTFNFLVSIKLLPKLLPVTLPHTVSEGDLRSLSPKPLPGSDAAEAERRRAIALKALDMRLNETGDAGGSSASGYAGQLAVESVPVAK